MRKFISTAQSKGIFVNRKYMFKSIDRKRKRDIEKEIETHTQRDRQTEREVIKY